MIAARLVLSALLFCLVAWSVPARAARGAWTLGLAPSYAYVVLEDRNEPKGGGGGMLLHYGLTDAVSLGLSGLWSGHRVDTTDDDSSSNLFQVTNFALSVQYAFDQLPICPAIEAGAGLLYLRYHGDSAFNFGLQLGISVEYGVLPWLLVGAAFHYHAFISNPNEYPVYFDAGPRILVRWQ